MQNITYTISGEIIYTAPIVDLIKGDGYYYVNLGYVDSEKTTPIRWRLISKDGTSAYTSTDFESDTIEDLSTSIGTGSVFLQETYLGDIKTFNMDSYNLTQVPSYISYSKDDDNSAMGNGYFWSLGLQKHSVATLLTKDWYAWKPYNYENGEVGVAWTIYPNFKVFAPMNSMLILIIVVN